VILYEICGGEDHDLYRDFEVLNGIRHYDFLKSYVECSVKLGRAFLSQHLIKAVNFHAITCLHTNPGEYRPCEVVVGDYRPPASFRVSVLMDDFVNQVNRDWETADPVVLASYVLWRLNHIHPFINGNGRTARAACYFVLCMKLGGWLPGKTILPELIRRERHRYVGALAAVTNSFEAGDFDLSPLHSLISELLTEQLESTGPEIGQAVTSAPSS
jgi:Fic family protein